MKNKNVSQSNLNFAHKVAAYLLSALMVVYPVSPSLAGVLDDYLIQTQLDTDPTFEYVNSEAEQYQITPFADGSVPVNHHVQSFYEQLLDSKSEALRDPPKLIPIAVGDITIFIPQAIELSLVGSPAVQNRYVRTQILNLLGRHLINPLWKGFETESAQIATLYDHAYDYASNNPDKKFGDQLELDTESNSTGYDFVWPEYRQINGESVLVPIVYLSEDTVAERRVVKAEREITGSARTFSLDLQGADVELGGFLQTAEDLINNRGSISSNADLQIIVGGALENLSGVIGSVGNLTVSANNITNKTIVYQYGDSQNARSYYAEIAEINSSTGDVVLRSNSDVTILGANVSASSGAITVAADGDIVVGTQRLYDAETWRSGRSSGSSSEVSYLTSRIGAEETIKLLAGGQIVIDSADISSDEGHIELMASMGISIVDSQGVIQSESKGKFGKKTVTESAYQTVAIRSMLDAGKGIKLSTDFGDITLKAADITSGEGTDVSAKNGAVNLLMTTETDHYSYSSVKKGMFTTTTVNKGHNIETGVPNSIVGGFSVEALSGINVEYEGDPDLTTEQQLDIIAKMPGMDWVNAVRSSPDVDWEEILLVHEVWYDKNTSLSPAFAAVIAIAVAVATGGAGAAAASAIGATGTVASAAVAAGVSSFISQATLAVANGAVNGDIGGALDDFASSDTLKSLTVAMVTAGAIAQVDATFFNVDGANVADANVAVESASSAVQAQAGVDAAINTTTAINGGLSLTAQLGQAVTHAAVQASAQAVFLGADLEEGFIQSLVSNSLNIVGEKLANKIGVAKAEGQIGTVTQLISHAAVGCLTGSISSSVAGGDTEEGCFSGGGGAVIGELIGLAYASKVEKDLDDWVKGQLADDVVLDQNAVMAKAMEFKRQGADMAKLGAALTAFAAGGDVDIAAMAGQNAAENNAFFLIAIVAVAAYTSYVSYVEGGLHEGLQSIGRGDDPLANAINSVVESGVELASESFPEETQKAAQILLAAGEKISAGVKIVMETEAGETVTRYWNEIREEDRNALVGAGSVISMVIPAGAIAKLKTLSNLDVEAGDWIKDPGHSNWEKVEPEQRELLQDHSVGAAEWGLTPSTTTLPDGSVIDIHLDYSKRDHVLYGDDHAGGGHSTNSGDVEIFGDVEVDSNGVRRAPVSINGVPKANSRDSISTLFPEGWTDADIMREFYDGLKEGATLTNNGYTVKTPGGVTVRFYKNASGKITTFYPLIGE